MVLLALSYSYCFSEDTVVLGTTNNAAQNGMTWNMDNVLPSESGLTIGGVIYQYTAEKDPASDLTVSIQNENALGEGYIFKETDDWSGLPGTTIRKIVPVPQIPREYFGKGEISLEGEGQVVDPTVRYAYRFDECFVPLTNPECPGYESALYDYLLENGYLDGRDISPNDPYYDEWVQKQLNNEIQETEEIIVTEEKEVDEEIDKLNGNASLDKMVDVGIQQQIMIELANTTLLNTYVGIDIAGGVYEESIILPDNQIRDNRRALRNLAQNKTHKDMVRSQYE